MTKREKINELEAELDNITDQLRNPHGCPDRIAIMITKEIIQAQVTALWWEFDDEKKIEGWQCPKCGSSVSPFAESCPFCNRQLAAVMVAGGSGE